VDTSFYCVDVMLVWHTCMSPCSVVHQETYLWRRRSHQSP